MRLQVDAFYDFWYTFKSWWEFPHPDEEDIEQVGGLGCAPSGSQVDLTWCVGGRLGGRHCALGAGVGVVGCVRCESRAVVCSLVSCSVARSSVNEVGKVNLEAGIRNRVGYTERDTSHGSSGAYGS